nr:glycosyltransferase family 4 protein [Rathayibacter sp. VKM Ac-2630]
MWLPCDVDYPERALTHELERRGHYVRRMDLPVLRRANLRLVNAPKLLRQFWATRNAIRNHQPDLVYVNTAALAPALVAVPLRKVPKVLHLHEYATGVESFLLSLMYLFAHRIVVVSDAVLKTLPRRARARAVVIRNGFELPPPVAKDSHSGQMVFVLASRWNAWKGHEVLLRSWAQTQREDARLLVLGGPPSSGETIDVLGLIDDLGITSSVEVIGETRDVRSIIDGADVILVPSIKPDPFPTIALEASGAGRAAIVSDTGGLSEIVVDGISGVTVPPGNVPAWTLAIDSITKEQAAEMGANARSRYEKEFTREIFTSRMRDLFSSVLNAVRKTSDPWEYDHPIERNGVIDHGVRCYEVEPSIA